MTIDPARERPATHATPADPIIVTGVPRAGVRLLAAILDAHPALASGPDLPIVATLVQQWRQIDDELGANHQRHHGVSREASRTAFRAAALKLLAPRLQLTGKTRFVLQSFTAGVLLEPFAAMLPAARFVFMTRQPGDVARSLLRCDWRDARNGQLLPYTRDPAAAARFYSGFMSLAAQSVHGLEAAGRLVTLSYEELCSDPRVAMARLGAFLEVSAPEPRVAADSAILVTRSPDNPHPPLRPGAVDSKSVTRPREPREAGQQQAAGAEPTQPTPTPDHGLGRRWKGRGQLGTMPAPRRRRR